MNAHDVRHLIRECEALAGISSASSHRQARIWRETVDTASGQVTREPTALLSPLMLAMNRLYDGSGLARTRARSEPVTLTSGEAAKAASG